MGATVVYNQNLGGLSIPDGVLIDVETQQAGTLVAGSINEINLVGTGTWGQFNVANIIGTPAQIATMIGKPQVSVTDLATIAQIALNAGVQTVKTVRIGSGTQVAAVLPVMGASTVLNTLTALYPGSAMNPPATPGVAAVPPATNTLTYSAGTPISQQSLSGNTQKVYLDLTVVTPLGTEVYQNLDGNLNTAGVYSITAPLLSAAIAAAVNNGTTLRGPSQFFVSTVPSGVSSAGAPVMNTANALSTQGTDGATFSNAAAMDAAMLGSNASAPYTGMYAFSGQMSGGVLVLVGDSDVSSIAGTALAFAKANNGHYCISYPQGTPLTGTGSAIDLKAIAGLGDFSLSVYSGDWTQIVDPNNGGIYRFVDPAALAAIQYAITGVPRSPANLPLPFVVGTARVTANGSSNVPYGVGELLAAENAGVNLWTNGDAGGGGFAIAHNKNSLGKTQGTLGNIAYGRNLQFAILAFDSPVVGAIVGGDQSFDGGDDTQRAAARALFNDLISGWQTDGIFDGTVPQVVCDLTNNAPGKGMLRVDIYLQQREIIDVVAIGLMSGVGPLVNVTPQAA
jgi:hypothetical protein